MNLQGSIVLASSLAPSRLNKPMSMIHPPAASREDVKLARHVQQLSVHAAASQQNFLQYMDMTVHVGKVTYVGTFKVDPAVGEQLLRREHQREAPSKLDDSAARVEFSQCVWLTGTLTPLLPAT